MSRNNQKFLNKSDLGLRVHVRELSRRLALLQGSPFANQFSRRAAFLRNELYEAKEELNLRYNRS
jgi:hypothetical protein